MRDRVVRRGRVVDRDGRPIAGAYVSVVWGTEAMPDIARRTDPEGRFQVGLPPGRFRLEAVAGDASARVEVDGGEGPDIVIHLDRP
jgi:hypothetical protein